MKTNPDSINVLDDEVIETVLREHWNDIVERSTRKVSSQVIWDRRLVQANRFLVAVAILMSIQSAWATTTLHRLLQ